MWGQILDHALPLAVLSELIDWPSCFFPPLGTIDISHAWVRLPILNPLHRRIPICPPALAQIFKFQDEIQSPVSGINCLHWIILRVWKPSGYSFCNKQSSGWHWESPTEHCSDGGDWGRKVQSHQCSTGSGGWWRWCVLLWRKWSSHLCAQEWRICWEIPLSLQAVHRRLWSAWLSGANGDQRLSLLIFKSPLKGINGRFYSRVVQLFVRNLWIKH